MFTALLHTFLKRKIFSSAYISQDLTLYPAFKDDASFILRSESVFTNPISNSLDLELKYIVNLDTKPSQDKKETDTQLLIGIKYKF